MTSENNALLDEACGKTEAHLKHVHGFTTRQGTAEKINVDIAVSIHTVKQLLVPRQVNYCQACFVKVKVRYIFNIDGVLLAMEQLNRKQYFVKIARAKKKPPNQRLSTPGKQHARQLCFFAWC